MSNVRSISVVSELNENKQCAIFTLLAMGFYLFSEPVFAQITEIAGVLCSVYGLIYFDIGRGLATLAIVSLGVGAMLGRVTWGQAVTVCAGIGCIFGALQIMVAVTSGISSFVSAALCMIEGTGAVIKAAPIPSI